MQISYSKLKSGNWGVRCKTEDPFEELPARGAEVAVVKRNGETQVKKLGAQVWSGEDASGYAVGLYALD